MYLVPCIVRHRYSWIIRFEGMPYAGSSLPLTVYVNDVGLTGTNPSGSTTTSPEVQSLAVAAVVTGFTVSFMGQTSTSQVSSPLTAELGKGQYRTLLAEALGFVCSNIDSLRVVPFGVGSTLCDCFSRDSLSASFVSHHGWPCRYSVACRAPKLLPSSRR